MFLAAATAPGWAATSPLGDWFTEDKRGIVRIAPCGPALCGFVVGMLDWQPNGDALRDIHGTSQCHLAIIRGLQPGNDGREHGTVTDPEDGRTYSAEVWVGDDGALRLRGYVGLEILGSTQRWEKSNRAVLPDCHFVKN